jgi:FkbM family methyltransferase
LCQFYGKYRSWKVIFYTLILLLMNIIDKMHVLHRVWRYRLRSEKESVKFLLDQDLRGSTLLDIGANKGIYSYWMSKKAGPGGKVISFEPQPELEDYLKDVKKTFRLENVEIQNKGMSDQPGKFEMLRKFAGAGGARLACEDEQGLPVNGALQKVEVELTTLDRFFHNRAPERLDFIKCDVEGHELAVFKGGEKLLKKFMPTLLFECGDTEAERGEIFSFLTALGYKGFFIYGNRRIDYREYKKYPYRKVSDKHRNYMFVKA